MQTCFGKMLRLGATALLVIGTSACGFHLRGEMPLATPLRNLYIQSSDPYGTLAKELETSLKMSQATLATNASEAQTTLVILQDVTSQDLLSVGGTQQTRQYRLSVTVAFELNDAHGSTLIAPQSLVESRVITIQSNQILGSSNEANLYFQQMRRTLASAIMYRLSSRQVTEDINTAFNVKTTPMKSAPTKQSKHHEN